LRRQVVKGRAESVIASAKDALEAQIVKRVFGHEYLEVL
jgi:hypothetical protein